jgi:predicted lipase
MMRAAAEYLVNISGKTPFSLGRQGKIPYVSPIKSSRQAMCYKRNIDERSCNHCCSIKETSIMYFEIVFEALCTQNATRVRHIVICGLSDATIFFHIIS